jgi:outer membrane protein assembly factor BamD
MSIVPSASPVLSYRSLRKFAMLLVVGVALAGCSGGSLLGGLGGGKSKLDTTVPPGGVIAPSMASPDEKAVADLYNDGLNSLNKGNFTTAQKRFAEVERQHPYSKWATQAILMQAFAAYQRRSYEDCINSASRFISLHPGHKDADYAYYLVALSEYERIAVTQRDQQQTVRAVEALEELKRRYPDTNYSRDADEKLLLALDRLAGKEMDVGRYYLGKGAHLAAINRFKKVVTDYQTSAHTPEALYRLTEAYMALGIMAEAQTAAAVLGHNYQNSRWYKDAYSLLATDGRRPEADRNSWISKAFGTVFSG